MNRLLESVKNFYSGDYKGTKMLGSVTLGLGVATGLIDLATGLNTAGNIAEGLTGAFAIFTFVDFGAEHLAHINSETI